MAELLLDVVRGLHGIVHELAQQAEANADGQAHHQGHQVEHEIPAGPGSVGHLGRVHQLEAAGLGLHLDDGVLEALGQALVVGGVAVQQAVHAGPSRTPACPGWDGSRL